MILTSSGTYSTSVGKWPKTFTGGTIKFLEELNVPEAALELRRQL